MMIIVGVLRQTGVFEYIAIWSAKRANGSPLRIMILLVLVTAFASALLDNVTTVLLIAPVTLLVCDRLGDQPGAVPDRRGVRVQHRRRVDTGRRSAQHHHRQPGRPDVQRLSSSHDADRGDRHRGRLHRDAAVAVPRLVRRRSRARGRRHVARRSARRFAIRRCSSSAESCSSLVFAAFIAASGAAHRTVDRGAAGRRRPDPDLAAGTASTTSPASSGRRCCSSPGCSSWSARW